MEFGGSFGGLFGYTHIWLRFSGDENAYESDCIVAFNTPSVPQGRVDVVLSLYSPMIDCSLLYTMSRKVANASRLAPSHISIP